MKKITTTLLCAFLFTQISISQNIGIGTPIPDSSAQLDVYSNKKGFLPPRVALISTDVSSPVNNPATGLLVYNTATSGGTPTNVSPGYYYWNGTNWYPIVNRGYSPGDMQYWDGTRWIMIPLGLNGQVLTICNGIPKWGNCQNTLTISPDNNSFEGHIDSYANSWNGGDTQFDITAWTANGSPENQRACLKFDFSLLPSNAVVDSAILYLYAMPNPHGGNGVDANFGPANAGFIQRITSTWLVTNPPYTWTNQPSTTTVNQVTIPQSTSSFSNTIANVSDLVKDMLINGSNGFFMKLQNEVTYNIRQFASSFNSDAGKHPKLIIYYH
jgi:hypothetical protein